MDFAQVFRRPHRYPEIASEQRVEAVDPQHLAVEHRAEIAAQDVRNILKRYGTIKFLLHGCNRLRGNTAGDNEVKETEIRVHVQGDTVGSNTARDVNAESSDLGFSRNSRASLDRTGVGARSHMDIAGFDGRPNPGQARDPLRRNSEFSTGAN